MSEPKIITASLEGMRIVVGEKHCELQEYNFVENRWLPKPKDEAPWPLTRAAADQWLGGWNSVDRFAAVNALTNAPDYPGEPSRAGRPFAELHH